ncbi:hypothetical protein F4818DRAFT_445188 [Hypoxylon cercidicola]|nr:hypothetical protein F4818DRAFT_445188 [Hypoxylon cercidicola]
MSTKGRKRKSTEAEPSERRQPDRQSNAPTGYHSRRRRGRRRAQLRDPRPTPGRVKRPRRDERELPDGFKERFYIPKPDKPKGRLSASRKDELDRQESLLDPTDTFHHLYVCHHKGREGSPTYDLAGFQLDWKKVDDWMKPQPYSKSRIVKGASRAYERHAREKRGMYEIFFVDGKGPEYEPSVVMMYLRDHVSKDLGIPWHQISPKQLVEWEKRGFPKQKAEEWWREPNEVESARIFKMLRGASLRKYL